MITRSRLVNDASMIAGNPANEPTPSGVPESLRFTTVAELEVELVRDLNLSPTDHLVSSVPVQLSVQDQGFIVPGASVESPCYVSAHSLDPPSWWPNSVDVEITSLSQINQNIWEGRLAVAFYDQRPIKGRVSWQPTGNETLTVWYDRSPQTDPDPSLATFIVTDSYVPLLKLLLAAQMLEFTKQPIGDFLMSRINRGLAQWEKYVKRNRQPGTVQKVNGLTALYAGRRRGNIWSSEFPVR